MQGCYGVVNYCSGLSVYRSSCGRKVAATASVEGEQSDRGRESAAAAANFRSDA